MVGKVLEVKFTAYNNINNNNNNDNDNDDNNSKNKNNDNNTNKNVNKNNHILPKLTKISNEQGMN